MSQEHDGELEILQNVSASLSNSSQILSEIKEETKQAKLSSRIKMVHVMKDLMSFNDFSQEKIVYEFTDNQTEAGVVINVPLFDQEDNRLSVRYLVATTEGFGYLIFDDFRVAGNNYTNDGVVKIELKSISDEKNIVILDYHQQAFEDLNYLDAYFNANHYGTVGQKVFSTNLHIYSENNILKSVGEIRIWTPHYPNKHIFTIKVPASDSQVKSDLQLISDQLMEMQQMAIDKANLELNKEIGKIDLARNIRDVLSVDTNKEEDDMERIEQPQKKKKRFGLF